MFNFLWIPWNYLNYIFSSTLVQVFDNNCHIPLLFGSSIDFLEDLFAKICLYPYLCFFLCFCLCLFHNLFHTLYPFEMDYNRDPFFLILELLIFYKIPFILISSRRRMSIVSSIISISVNYFFTTFTFYLHISGHKTANGCNPLAVYPFCCHLLHFWFVWNYHCKDFEEVFFGCNSVHSLEFLF